MESPLVNFSKWKKSDLDGKTIEFRIPTEKFGAVEGRGQISISHPNREGLFRVDILHQIDTLPGRGGVLRKYHLSQSLVDQIRNHPEPAVAELFLVYFHNQKTAAGHTRFG